MPKRVSLPKGTGISLRLRRKRTPAACPQVVPFPISFIPSLQEAVFEKELSDFLGKLFKEGLPEEYSDKGNKVWLRLAANYGLKKPKKTRFNVAKSQFLKRIQVTGSSGWSDEVTIFRKKRENHRSGFSKTTRS